VEKAFSPYCLIDEDEWTLAATLEKLLCPVKFGSAHDENRTKVFMQGLLKLGSRQSLDKLKTYHPIKINSDKFLRFPVTFQPCKQSEMLLATKQKIDCFENML
jgi:hypothetical protein